MFRMEIATANAAFVDMPGEALAELLIQTAERVREGLSYAPDADQGGTLKDVNGGAVGEWQYTPEN
jgi:hypothetical protein